jgi:hypothetical protein
MSKELSLQEKQKLLNWVKKYYPFYDASVSSAYIMFNSEYNDETYDNTVTTILVFDKNGNEITPTKGNSIKARENLPEFWDYLSDDGCGTEEYLENFVVDLLKD